MTDPFGCLLRPPRPLAFGAVARVERERAKRLVVSCCVQRPLGRDRARHEQRHREHLLRFGHLRRSGNGGRQNLKRESSSRVLKCVDSLKKIAEVERNGI